MTCPLCTSPLPDRDLRSASGGRYRACPVCHLISMHPAELPPPEAERNHYLTHENDPAQPGYRRFLERLVVPMRPFLNASMRVLDYGCGPGPAVHELLRESGVACHNYDPVFGPAELDPPYDAVLSTETVEHFHQPARAFAHMLSLLSPGGLLGILTQRWTSLDRFAEWGYVRDPTHTAFYHERTFEWMARTWNLDILWKNERDAVILRKHP